MFIKRQQIPTPVDLSLETVQLALQEAAIADDAGKMAEFMLLHSRRLGAILQESPLQALRNGSLVRSRQLADLYDAERSVLWYLLLAWELKETSRLDEAREMLVMLQQKPLPHLSNWQDEYGGWLLERLWEVSQEICLSLAQQILADDGRKVLCEYLVNHGDLGAAVEIARPIKSEVYWALALKEITQAIAQIEDRITALSLLEKTVIIAREFPNKNRRAIALNNITTVIAKNGDSITACSLFEEALTIVRQIEDELHRTMLLFQIVKDIAQNCTGITAISRLEKTTIVAREIQKENLRAMLLGYIAVALAQNGGATTAISSLEKALTIAGEIQDESSRAEALSGIATAITQNGDNTTATRLLGEALTIARQIPSEEKIA
ncbi:MAG TPA: hypothetical protein IGS52_16425, partial [Oscillatoriaceae cyanobacterium M33_DOE_052]|nr:hypothetical protein [Oscillatoriaceae cyanobacterium M33_DOE_052]